MVEEIKEEDKIPSEVRRVLAFVAQFPELHRVGPEFAARKEYWGGLTLQLLDELEAGRLSKEQFVSLNAGLVTAKEWLSDHDPLTRLYNQRGFNDSLEREVAARERGGGPMSLLLADLDHLREINKAGHATGDAALKDVASVIEENMPAGSLAARVGGDEFAVVLPIGLADSQGIAEKILESARRRPPRGGVELSVSIGVGEWRSEETARQFYKRVDKGALLVAKEEGRGRVKVIE